MARYDVSSWEQFVSAWKTVDGNDIIEVNADLDVNDNIPDRAIVMEKHSVDGPVTINGNGHTIYNVSGGGGMVFENTYHRTTINSLNFQNFNLTTPLFRGYSYDSQLYLNDSNIQGRDTALFFVGYVNFDRCTLTLTNTRSQITPDTENNVYFTRCWIYFRSCKKTWNGGDTPLIRNINTCYLKGEIDMTDKTNTNIVSSVNNSCINVTVTGVTAENIPLTRYVYDSRGLMTIVNTSKLNKTPTASEESLVKGVTDAQMKNADYLFDLGFDIVPSGE